MNAQKFLSLIKKGNQMDKEDFKAAIKLHEDFPYFLIPKVLAAKYEMQKSSGQSKELLHWAAVLSPDRKRLRQLIEKPLPLADYENHAEIKGEADLGVQVKKENPAQDAIKEDTGSPPASGHSGEGNEDSKEDGEGEKEGDQPKPDRSEILKKLEENLNKIKQSSAKKKPEAAITPKDPTINPTSFPQEDLISSIKKKKKLKLLDEKIKEQNNIIKSFHEKPIKLSAVNIQEEYDKLPDLSEKSTILNDNTVSESFAKLLIRQNKKKEAIEIYQKLMLKFPDKKTYFADQIAQLKA